jgi:hypothetical protein
MTTRDDLQICTVRLNFAGSQGTGFFVAPNLIFTCAHVVKSAGDNPVQVFWQTQNQDYTATIKQLFPYPIDLALLELQGDTGNHPCVELDRTEPNLNDDLYIFGYPKNSGDDYSQGDSASFKYEGISFKQDITLYKLKQGQVKTSRFVGRGQEVIFSVLFDMVLIGTSPMLLIHAWYAKWTTFFFIVSH